MIKSILIFFLTLCIVNSIFSQKKRDIVFEYPKGDFFYYKANNKVKIIVEGINCEDYEVVCDSCIISRKRCDINIIPLDSSFVINTFKVIYKKDTFFGNIIVSVDKPMPTIEKISNYYFFDAFYKVDSVVAFSYHNTNIKYIVDSFEFSLIRDSNIIYNRKIIGNSFSEKDRNTIKKLFKFGDLFICSNIYITGSDGTKHKSRFEKIIGNKIN